MIVDAPSSQDAAIGNIMGSNSANVFLGLGIPWVIASIYYQVRGGGCSTNLPPSRCVDSQPAIDLWLCFFLHPLPCSPPPTEPPRQRVRSTS